MIYNKICSAQYKNCIETLNDSVKNIHLIKASKRSIVSLFYVMNR